MSAASIGALLKDAAREIGPTDARVWAPRGRNVTVIQAAQMPDITVAQVIAAALK